MPDDLGGAVGRSPSVAWSICVRDVDCATVVAQVDPDRVLSTASIGKLLLLAELARQLAAGELDRTELLARTPQLAVADSGLWQHLSVDRLSVDDLAVLVGSVSDNLATNVLLERVGLGRVSALAASLGLRRTAALDRVREVRTAEHPARLSVGSAAELSDLVLRLARRTLVSAQVSDHLDRWLSSGVDLSMVARPFGFDPLAHVDGDRGVVLRNKTGTDSHVRADVGHVRGPDGWLAYAVLANWDTGGPDLRDDVLAGMERAGRWLAARVGAVT